MKHLIQLLCLSLFLLGFPSIHYADEVVYYHTDNFGTPMAMTDQSGKVVWRSDELPFGEEYDTEELPLPNNRRFLGKELDKETGLIYMGARYLDPKTGRFTQPDPVGIVDPFNHGKINQAMLENPQRQNRYVYGLNNPYKYVDPDGNWAEAVFIEGPSIALGAHSFASNIKQGNIGSAVVDAVGVVADTAAAIAPGIPGGVGLGIKVQRASKAAAAEVRAKNISKGIAAELLGPSGKPKIHVKKHSSLKKAKDAARARVGAGGSTMKHPSPQRGNSHFHGKTQQGVKSRVHDDSNSRTSGRCSNSVTC